MSKIVVVRDDGIPAYGAWGSGSLRDEQGLILLNVQACLEDMVDEDGKPVQMNRARVVVETLMHEFGHAVEEALGLEHDDTLIEDATNKFFR